MPDKAASTIAHIIAPTLKEAGFRKNELTWRREREPSIQIVEVQPSRLGDLAYINLGVYFRELGANTAPDITECHVRARLNGVVPAPQRQTALMSFMNEVTLQERQAEVPVLMRDYGIAWLDENQTMQAARDRMRRTGRRPMIHDDALSFFTSGPDAP
jgi:hypothetical protein